MRLLNNVACHPQIFNLNVLYIYRLLWVLDWGWMTVEEEEEAERSFGAYLRLLRDYPGWRILWIGEVWDSNDTWIEYNAKSFTRSVEFYSTFWAFELWAQRLMSKAESLEMSAYYIQLCLRILEERHTFQFYPIEDTCPIRLCMQILSNIGNWFNYVATLLVVERLANGRGIFLSIVLVIHFLPSLVWFPLAGLLADRFGSDDLFQWSWMFIRFRPDLCCHSQWYLISNKSINGTWLLLNQSAKDDY